MALLTLSEAQAAVESGLSDSVLQIYLDAAEADIVRYAGPNGATVTHEAIVNRGQQLVLLPRRAESITSVEVNGVALNADEYQIDHGGLAVRLYLSYTAHIYRTDGYYRYRPWKAVIMYTAVDDDAQRKLAQIQLVRLAVQHDGLAANTVGQYNRTSADYGKERARILAALRTASTGVA